MEYKEKNAGIFVNMLIAPFLLVAVSGCSCDRTFRQGPGQTVEGSPVGQTDPALVGQNGWPCTSSSACRTGECVGGACVGSCVDIDNDFHGQGCALGVDCDDNDSSRPSREICDDNDDNDCDGLIDDDDEDCTGCTGVCDSSPRGIGGVEFNPGARDSQDVGLDEEGALILDSSSLPPDVIWIANSGEGTISKVSTNAPYTELGRYQTGPESPPSLPGRADAHQFYPLYSGNDPSRTSVDPFSNDVYVANREGGSVTRMSELGDRCPDRWGGGNRTSSGGDVLPWSDKRPTDDCIVWHTELWWDTVREAACSRAEAQAGRTSCVKPNRVRAIATEPNRGLDGNRSTAVWVGAYTLQAIWKLSDQGEVLFATKAPVRPYGFAVDKSDNLWISSGWNDEEADHLGRIDTKRCSDESSCNSVVCDSDPSNGTIASGPCTKERIATPPSSTTKKLTWIYGITVDNHQRVWLSGTPWVLRYDPGESSVRSRWNSTDIGRFTYGITADRGYVYVASGEEKAIQLDADDPSKKRELSGTEGKVLWGAAADFDGKVWFINRGRKLKGLARSSDTSDVTLVTPRSSAIGDVAVSTNVASYLFKAYTYSDMSGSQVRNATDPEGFYREVFEACPGGDQVTWKILEYETETPSGTLVTFRVRTASSEEDLSAQPWTVVANAPDDEPPIDLEQELLMSNLQPKRFLELEVILTTRRTGEVSATPRVLRFDVGHECSVSLE